MNQTAVDLQQLFAVNNPVSPPASTQEGNGAQSSRRRGKKGSAQSGKKSSRKAKNKRKETRKGPNDGSDRPDEKANTKEQAQKPKAKIPISKLRKQAQGVNLSVLKQLDGDITDILHTAKHTAIYKLVDKSWERQEMEGPMFVVERSSSPTYKLIVLNRLSLTNFVLPIEKSIVIEASAQYLFLKSSSQISCLWFYEKEEQNASAAFITELVASTKEEDADPRYLSPEMSAVAHSSDFRLSPLGTPGSTIPVLPQGQLLTPQALRSADHPRQKASHSRVTLSKEQFRQHLQLVAADDLLLDGVYKQYRRGLLESLFS